MKSHDKFATRRRVRWEVTTAALFLAAAPAVHASIDETIEEALKIGGGRVTFDLTYRYEYANTQDNPRETANASTARLRLGYLTPKFYGFQGFAEFEGNQDIVENDYSSFRNGNRRKAQYDVIQDPQDTELNRLWISYDGVPDTLFKVGRQRIKLDNDRFIGNVGWRQLEQTYDSVLVRNTSLPDTTVTLGYLNQVRTIVSTTDDIDAPIVNIAYKGLGFGTAIGYAYLLDYNEGRNYLNSSQTYGFRFDGSAPVTDDITALYTAEYAWQKDYERNPGNYEVDYVNVAAGATVFGITGKVGWEQLGGQGGFAFRTPLGTNHAFQGWADLFLVTPVAGIRDIYGLIGTDLMGVKLMAVYHDFDDDTGSINYGKEIDLQAVKKFGKHYSVLLKYAKYDADSAVIPGILPPGNVDTQKFWIQGNVSF